MCNKRKKRARLVLASILAGAMAASHSTFAAPTYDYIDGHWLQTEAVPTYRYTSNDKDITDWAVPVFDKQGKQVFELLYIPEGEKLLKLYSYTSSYEMLKDAETGKEASPLLNQAMVIGTKYWADVINKQQNLSIRFYYLI